jgi:Tfp pilus assembly protein PilZ
MRILKARFKTREAFLDAFQEAPPPGAIFCATTQPLARDEAAVVEVFFPGLPNRVLVRGAALWWRRALPRQRVRAGCLLGFDADEKDKVHFLRAAADGGPEPRMRRRHARLPVRLPVRWSKPGSSSTLAAHIEEIGIGGALLVTGERPPIGTDVVLDLLVPGGARTSALAARVAYTAPTGVGLRFVYRDGGGSRRMRELIRRIKAHPAK